VTDRHPAASGAAGRRTTTERARGGESMTEPSQQRPVPDDLDPAADRFADLEQRPVADHVAVFEDEHGRLQRELGTIDQL
jgi:hypothetical protein